MFLLLVCFYMLLLNLLVNVIMSLVFAFMIIVMPVILMLIVLLVILMLIISVLLTLFDWSVTFCFSNDVSWFCWSFECESDSTTADCVSNKFLIISFFVCSSTCRSLIFSLSVSRIFCWSFKLLIFGINKFQQRIYFTFSPQMISIKSVFTSALSFINP